jgi:hypothetical protein
MPPYNPNLKVNSSLKTSNLVTLRTDLKSLKYGLDRPGGGSSGQPYIQTKIPSSNLVSLNPDTFSGAGNTNPIYKVGSTGGLDFPIRGGTIEVNLGSQTFTLSSKIDKERIRKFYEDDPRGATFKRKQIELQLTNPLTQTGNSFFKLGNEYKDLGARGLLGNNRIYNNGRNTLASVGLSGTGLRATRQGLLPIDTGAKYYLDVVSAESRLSTYEVTNTNRLLILNNLKMTSGATFNRPFAGIVQANKLGISLNKNLLFDYLTGPGSVYGLGKTTIKRSKDSDTRGAATKYTSMKGMTYDNIISQNLNNTTDGIRTTAIQAGYVTGSVDTREKIYSYNYDTKVTLSTKKSDKINFDKIVSIINKDPWTTDKSTNDLIKFGFECIDNDNPLASIFLQFRAYLDGGISDSNQGEWNSFRYIGRGEEFFTYQGFTRTITFAFKIAAQSSEELLPIYDKINYLMSQVYPDYSSKTNIMRAPVVRLTIGDYLYRVPGILQNVNLQVDQATSWEIRQLDEKKRIMLGELPQQLSVNVTFKPIMDELPKRSKGVYASNLIANKKIKDINEVNSSINSSRVSGFDLLNSDLEAINNFNNDINNNGPSWHNNSDFQPNNMPGNG